MNKALAAEKAAHERQAVEDEKKRAAMRKEAEAVYAPMTSISFLTSEL